MHKEEHVSLERSGFGHVLRFCSANAEVCYESSTGSRSVDVQCSLIFMTSSAFSGIAAARHLEPYALAICLLDHESAPFTYSPPFIMKRRSRNVSMGYFP